jgi:hypothetical protein
MFQNKIGQGGGGGGQQSPGGIPGYVDMSQAPQQGQGQQMNIMGMLQNMQSQGGQEQQDDGFSKLMSMFGGGNGYYN